MAAQTEALVEPPFDQEEAARRLGQTVSWVKAHRAEIPHIRMGRFRRYTQAHLDAYLARQTVQPSYKPTGRSQARQKGRAA